MPPFFFLGYGVMVTLQILVLPFLVRVRVAQRSQTESHPPSGWLFLFSYRHIFNRCSVRIGGYRDPIWGVSLLPYLLSRIELAISVPVLPISDAAHCNRSCSALQPPPQCTASVLAVHCILPASMCNRPRKYVCPSLQVRASEIGFI